MSDFSTIKIKHIPALFPDVNYEDIFFDEHIFRKLPSYELVTAKTEALLTTVENPNISKNLIVQSIFYDTYQVETLVKGVSEIANIGIAEKVVIIDDNNNEYLVELIDNPEFSQSDTTGIYKVVLKFKHFINDSTNINNYLTSDYILEKFETTALWKITLANSKDVILVDKDGNETKYGFSGNYAISQSITNSNTVYLDLGNGVYEITIPNSDEAYNYLSVGSSVSLRFVSDNYDKTFAGQTITAISDTELSVRVGRTGISDWTSTMTVSFAGDPYTIDFYTKIIPLSNVLLIRENIEEQEDIIEKILSNVQKVHSKAVYLYLTETEKALFDMLSGVCDNVILTAPDATQYKHLGYLSNEQEDRNLAIPNIYERIVNINYQKMNYYPFPV